MAVARVTSPPLSLTSYSSPDRDGEAFVVGHVRGGSVRRGLRSLPKIGPPVRLQPGDRAVVVQDAKDGQGTPTSRSHLL